MTPQQPGESRVLPPGPMGVFSQMSAAAPATTFSSLDLRSAFAQFPQAVVVLGAEVDGTPEALVASTFTVGVSLEPPLATVAVQHSSSTWPKLRDGASHLGVSLLGADQQHLCRQLASKNRAERFSGVEYSTDEGAIELASTPVWLKTRIYNQFTAGDHDIVVLQILDLTTDETAAGLVFHRSTFHSLPHPEQSA